MSDAFAEMYAALDEAAPDAARVEQALRWRLMLGGFADRHLSFDRLGEAAGGGSDGDLAALLTEAQQAEIPLAYLYDREHAARAHRGGAGGGTGLSVPAWLDGVRALFPKEAVRIMERDALTRYGLDELVTDPEILRQSEPSPHLLSAILQFKHLMKGEVLEAARAIVKAVVDDLRARLETECRPALYGPVGQGGRAALRTWKNVDWRRTIGRNLKNYDQARGRLVADRIDFKQRQRRRSPWRVIIAVDQSGSMTDSLIHGAVMAAIFAGLPAVEVQLVLWDHRVVDVSHLAGDPLEVLMGVQLGGGTRMREAMQYCADRVVVPRQTLLCLLSDWYVWGEAEACLTLAKELAEAGVTCVGLSALNTDSVAVADERFARRLAGCGWFVAAMTPKALAEHVGRIIGA